MKPCRPVLALLLSLLIPLSGFASLESEMGDCPLQEGPAAEAAMGTMPSMDPSGAMPDMDKHEHPCCQDEDTASRTGQLCKPGQECGTGLSLPAMSGAGRADPLPGGVPAFAILDLPSARPDDLLRPPLA